MALEIKATVTIKNVHKWSAEEMDNIKGDLIDQLSELLNPKDFDVHIEVLKK